MDLLTLLDFNTHAYVVHERIAIRRLALARFIAVRKTSDGDFLRVL